MKVHEHAKKGNADAIKALLDQSKHREYDVNVLKCDESVIRHWMHHSQMPSPITSDESPLTPIFDHLNDDGVRYLSLLKDTFMLRQNDRCLRVLVFLLNLPRSRIFKPKTDPSIQITSVCFQLIFEWCEGNQDCQDFVGYSSDLFFYKANKKTIKERFPALLVSFIVGFNGKVSCEPLATSHSTSESTMSYLFECVEADRDIIEDVNACKARKSEETLSATRRLFIQGNTKILRSDNVSSGVKVRKCL
jgi:hypothetical protein